MSNTNRHTDHNPMGLTKKITIITISNNPPMQTSDTTQTHIQTVRVTLPQFVRTEATPIYLESQTLGGNSNTNLTTNAAQTSGRQNHNTSNENDMLLKRVQQLEDQADNKIHHQRLIPATSTPGRQKTRTAPKATYRALLFKSRTCSNT